MTIHIYTPLRAGSQSIKHRRQVALGDSLTITSMECSTIFGEKSHLKERRVKLNNLTYDEIVFDNTI